MYKQVKIGVNMTTTWRLSWLYRQRKESSTTGICWVLPTLKTIQWNFIEPGLFMTLEYDWPIGWATINFAGAPNSTILVCCRSVNCYMPLFWTHVGMKQHLQRHQKCSLSTPRGGRNLWNLIFHKVLVYVWKKMYGNMYILVKQLGQLGQLEYKFYHVYWPHSMHRLLTFRPLTKYAGPWITYHLTFKTTSQSRPLPSSTKAVFSMLSTCV